MGKNAERAPPTLQSGVNTTLDFPCKISSSVAWESLATAPSEAGSMGHPVWVIPQSEKASHKEQFGQKKWFVPWDCALCFSPDAAHSKLPTGETTQRTQDRQLTVTGLPADPLRYMKWACMFHENTNAHMHHMYPYCMWRVFCQSSCGSKKIAINQLIRKKQKQTNSSQLTTFSSMLTWQFNLLHGLRTFGTKPFRTSVAVLRLGCFNLFVVHVLGRWTCEGLRQRTWLVSDW